MGKSRYKKLGTCDLCFVDNCRVIIYIKSGHNDLSRGKNKTMPLLKRSFFAIN